jgi:hypothetical protein
VTEEFVVEEFTKEFGLVRFWFAISGGLECLVGVFVEIFLGKWTHSEAVPGIRLLFSRLSR